MFKYMKWLISVEFLFSLFVYSGYFKGSLPFISFDITIFLLILTFLMAISQNIKSGFKINKQYLLPIILFITIQFIMMFSLYYTPSTINSIEKTGIFITITSWCFIGSFFIIKDWESIKKFLLGVFMVTLIMSLSAFFNTSINGGFVGAFGTDNYIPLARASSVSIIILLSFYLTSKHNIYLRLFSLFLSLILIIPLLQSGARLSVVVMMIVIAIIPLFLINFTISEFLTINNRMKSFIPLLALIGLSLYITIYKGYAETLIMRINVLNGQIASGSNIAGRSDRIDKGLDMVKDSYFLGKGIDSFSVYYSGIDFDTPHNIYIEYLAELGFVALIIFLIIVIIAFYNGLKSYKKTGESFLMFTMLIIFLFWLINSFGSSSINGDRMFYSVLSIMYMTPYMKKNNISEG